MPFRSTPLAGVPLLMLAIGACGDGVADVEPPPPAAFDSGGGAIADADARDAAAPLVDASRRDAATSVDTDASAPKDATAPRDAALPRDAGASRSPLCQGAATAAFEAPATCNALSGNTTTTRPSNAIYATSWFGCYRNAAGAIVKDPYDNCEFACGSRGLCASNLSGPECQAQLEWFAADADRFGCGARVKVTNCANGRAVVLAALDRGPNCRTVEQAYGAPVLDMSRPAMTYLFEGRTYGGADKRRVVAEVVPATTALGPVD